METMHDSDIGCDVPSGVSDASASLEAFEMLIETVNMSQKSMGDACLCALKCGRIGLENKVTELLIRKLENVPTLERKIVLLYVVNHILHASRFAAGWMRTYVLAFKEALPRIIGAGGPPGPDAEEYRKTCQRFLREWKIKQVLPSFFLRPFITEIPNRYQFPPRSSVHRPYHSTRGNQLNAYERIELGKHDISAIDSKNPEPSSSTKHWLSSSTFVSGTDGMYPSPSAVKGPFPFSSSSLQADVAPSPTLRRPSITGYSNKDMTAGFPTRRPHTDQRMYTFSSNGHAYIHKTCDEKLIYQAALEDLNQPNLEANLPDGLLSVSLLRHQKIALAWMLQKETCKSLPCLGGILADEQGLGKTISMIALIQMQRFLQSKSKPEYLDKDKVSKTTYEQRPTTDATLVVCPASVLRQWDRELDDKVADEAKLSVLVYHGGNRTKINPDELARYNVVLTTYAIVTNECLKGPRVGKCVFDFSINNKKRKMASSSSSSSHRGSGPLARVDWYRVILDEAQMIKNQTTQVAKACCSLEAKTRWCLSGTPIQNRIDDLYSYFRFLKYDPYDAYGSFQHMIKGSISRDSQQGYKKVQAILRAIMLRRRKETIIDGQPILNLPPKTINLRQVRFSSKERAFYNQVESGSRAQFKAYADAGTISQNYAHILVMLLRLRQACDHPLLVSGEKDSVDMASDKLSRDMLMHLLNVLEDSEAICCVCNDVPENPVVTMCGHVLCFQCVSEHMTGDDSMCATTDECMELPIFSKSTLRSRLSFRDNLDGGQMSTENSKSPAVEYYMSSKVRTTIELLQSSSHDDDDSSYPNIKTIIFSQWTKMLDLVENAIKDYCISIQYRRLDGTMTLASRDMAVKEFNTDPEVTVMLMSLKAGNLGLNMVSACHVFLLDPWWNPTTEDQAVDRAHRIGQTRPVTVTRLTIKDTVEDRILALQDKKRKMVASAFGEDNAGGCATRLTVEDLKYLFMV